MDIVNELQRNHNIKFNDQQLKVIHHVDGPVLVLAVPGGGKTTTMLARTSNLIKNHNINPNKILTVTFSKASAADMEERFNELFYESNIEGVSFSTIHSFAYRVFMAYSRRNDITFENIEGNSSTQYSKSKIIRYAYKKYNNGYLNDIEYDTLVTSISLVANKMLDHKQITCLSTLLDKEEDLQNFDKVLNYYNCFKKDNNLIDFDDMLVQCYAILKQNKNILNYYQNKYTYFQIDEGQDTSLIQHKIIELLAQKNKNIFCVGDDDQGIYGFRGASPEYLLEFDQHYSDPQILLMERNYRSTQKIVNLSNVFIKKNTTRYEKNILTENPEGDNIAIYTENGVQKNNQIIVDIIMKSEKLSDNAILFRTNYSSIHMAISLYQANISFYVKGVKNNFFTHWIVNDILEIMRFSYNQNDAEAFSKFYYKLKGYYISKNMVSEIINDNQQMDSVFNRLEVPSKFKSKYKKNKSKVEILSENFNTLSQLKPKEAIVYILNILGYVDYLFQGKKGPNNAKQIINLLKLISEEAQDFNELIEKLTEYEQIIKQSAKNKNKDCVTLSTIHSAKGLEWNTVFIIDINNGIFPGNQIIEDNNIEAIEEERRLFYVGMTRAKHKLFLFGEEDNIFLSEVQDILVPKKKNKTKRTIKKKNLVDTSLFIPGADIMHKQFGVGKVLSVNGDVIDINFNGKKKTFALEICVENNLLEIY
jgi:DNA helicase-2/ATP-dependent DNA helicase PcrA